ncbi:thiosulfate oxidation carrier protein SoxY [Oricola nitratireducens]|uniref:thiosulfate oxidation carrier protein SoxY n=1 Tax=Oricola nitratireducens TaxID=2775868 RepID=UPI0018679BA7|nr:thiosulfate oxidation carrier protein SoxY [Oricola nitratireducens]
MTLTRRSMLTLSVGAAIGVAAGMRTGPAAASAEDAMAKVKEFAGGAEPATGTITLDAPEIAENGNTVPISVSVDSPMTDDDYVTSVAIYADGNPSPEVITFNFTPLSGEASATTRMRLAKTQNVIAVAKTSKGGVFMDKKEVKVTIGGCGG